MPRKEVYLQYRSLFVNLGLNYEVAKLDAYYNIVKIYDKKNRLILIK